MKHRVFAALAVCSLAAAACNDVPVRNLTSSYQIQIQELRDRGKPAKLDILWVVDDSPSMCQEQQNLAQSFKAFLEVFQKYTAIDMQLAVTTTNVCPTSKDGAIRGKFLYQPATDVPPDCVQKRVVPCLNDAQCQARKDLPDAANWVCEPRPAAEQWTCDTPPDIKDQGVDDKYEGDFLYTVSSQCRYRCDRDANPGQCARVFDVPQGCSTATGDDAPLAMCEAGTCTAAACTANESLVGTVDCATRCRGAECAAVCGQFLADTAQCQGKCDAAGGDCIQVCQQVSKSSECDNVCADWSCQQTCETYLHDAGKCGTVCGSADEAACRTACGTQFKNQEFLCLLSCANTYSCSDRCIAQFGLPEYRCLYPGNDPTKAGCLRPPATAYCPGGTDTTGDGVPDKWAGPTILNNQVADQYLKDWMKGTWAGDPDWDPAWKNLPQDDSAESFALREIARGKVFEQIFKCMATVGADQKICANQEQGLRAAWLALDPEGENGDQARRFLRDDAYLLIVVIGDEDDCSAPEYEKSAGVFDNVVPAEDFGRCSCLRDENGCLPNGDCDPTKCLTNNKFDAKKCPLYSTARFVNQLRALKSDPAQVVFATITGDVMTMEDQTPDDPSDDLPNHLTGLYPSGTDVQSIRQRYFDCKCDVKAPKTAPFTFVCLSGSGKADLGIRYATVASAFGLGRYGQLSNICSESGIEPSLEKIANLVIPLLTQVCLPRPMEWSCQGKCEVLDGFQDREKCQQACGAADCFETCQDVFGGVPGCAEICASGEFVEVYKYDAKGVCAKRDAGGNCLPLDLGADYSLVANSPVCPLSDVTLGERQENAIQFSTPLEYNDRIEIVYRAGSFTCQDRCGRIFRDQATFCDNVCDGTPDQCIDTCVKGSAARSCGYVCGVKTDTCIQRCESTGATNCNAVCKDGN